MISDQSVWLAAYTACLGGLLAGPQGAHLAAPHVDTLSRAVPNIDRVSSACRAYADRALVDFKARVAS